MTEVSSGWRTDGYEKVKTRTGKRYIPRYKHQGRIKYSHFNFKTATQAEAVGKIVINRLLRLEIANEQTPIDNENHLQ